MQAFDRRLAPRFRINIPLHYQLGRSESECAAQSLDISAKGACILTKLLPNVGSTIQLRLRMPEMITGRRAPEWRISGHVVHVRAAESEEDSFKVGVQFDYYEAAQDAERSEGQPLSAPASLHGHLQDLTRP